MTLLVPSHSAEIGSPLADQAIGTQVVGKCMAITDDFRCETSESSHYPAHSVLSNLLLPEHLLAGNVPLELTKGSVLHATVVLTDEAQVSPVEIREPDRTEFVADLYLQLRSGQPERMELNPTE